jgi:tetratricopeptide (TPR) repeat protein
MKMEKQRRSGSLRRGRVVLIETVVIVLLTGLPALAQGKPAKMGRVGCPQCVNDGSPISQSLQKVDEFYARFKVKEAQSELLKVLTLDADNTEALSKLARVHIDYGDIIPESSFDWQEKRLKQYRTAEEYARRAVKAGPTSTWGYFYVAASLGSIAALSPVAEQIDLSGEVRSAVEKSIELDPKNGFAYHVYGIWHRKMAEIGRMSRVFAAVIYGRSIPTGSLDKSIDYLTTAVALNPTVIASRLELARSYADAENWPSAHNSLLSVRELPVQFSDDARYKKQAEQLLEEIKDR